MAHNEFVRQFCVCLNTSACLSEWSKDHAFSLLSENRKLAPQYLKEDVRLGEGCTTNSSLFVHDYTRPLLVWGFLGFFLSTVLPPLFFWLCFLFQHSTNTIPILDYSKGRSKA